MKVYVNDEKKICRPTASFKEGWTVLTETIVLGVKLMSARPTDFSFKPLVLLLATFASTEI